MGHPVALVEDDPQKFLFHLRGHLPGVLGEGLGVGADVGQGGAQFVGDVGYELPAHLLGFPLLGNVVEDHQGAAPRPSPVEGGHQQLEVPLPDLPLLLQVVLGVQHLGQGGPPVKEGLIGAVRPDGLAQHPGGGGVGVNHPPLPGEGHHPVGHVEEEGVQLVALVLHLAQGILELSGHVVEGVGEHADLVLGEHLDLSGEVPLRHPHSALGQLLDGRDHGLGQQDGQQDGDHQPEDQRLDDQQEHLTSQVVGGGLVVQDINHIVRPAPGDGDGHIHIVQGRIALVPGLPGAQGVDQVLAVLHPQVLPVGRDQAGAAAVQDIQLAVPAVHAQLAGVGVQHQGHLVRPVLLLLRRGGQVVVEQRVLEHVRHLAVEVLQIERRHRVDQERPHHHHQRQDQQHHDHHQLHPQTAQHGRDLLSSEQSPLWFFARGRDGGSPPLPHVGPPHQIVQADIEKVGDGDQAGELRISGRVFIALIGVYG